MSPQESIAHYRITGKLGEGGMGEVYRATDTKLNREVAIKVLPEAFAQDADRMARFKHEAQVLALLNHPNIAAIYGVEERALVMELVEGPTLAERIAQGPIPMDEALPIARQMAEALEYAHEKGIVHRDLKPANVKVTPEGRVKVLDFGLAKALSNEAASTDPASSPTFTMRATLAGVIMGTAAYMSPEQAKGKPVDRRADIWSFGVVLAEMLTGRQMYRGETISEILAAVLLKDPDWSGLPAATPSVVRRLLRRCLEKDPQRRLRDIGEARIAIEEALAGAPAEDGMPAAVVANRNRLLPWIAGASLLALAALAFIHFRETPPPAAEVMRFQIPPPDKTYFSGARIPSVPFVSPDGRQVAFFARGTDGRSQIWIRSLHAPEARPLLGTEGNPGAEFGALAWSPDSRSLAFITGPGNQVDLKRIEVAGGPPQTLVTHTPSLAPDYAWSREDVILFNAGTGLRRVSASGGAASTVTTLDTARGETRHTSPSFLPDGRHFVYVRSSSRLENSGVYVGSLDTKPEQQSLRRMLAAESGAVYASTDSKKGHLLFLRGGTLLAQPFDTSRMDLAGNAVPVAEHVGSGGILQSSEQTGLFSASATGVLAYRTGPASGGNTNQLAWFDRRGQVLGAAVEERLRTPNLSLSPDGAQVAFVRTDNPAGTGDIWLHDVARGTSSRFTSDPAADTWPVWSPDARYIVFASERDGIRNLYRKLSSNAGPEEVLLRSNEPKTPTDWSRDGRFLLYTNIDPKTGNDIWFLPLTPEGTGGEPKPTPYLKTEFFEANGRFSPDGRFVAYHSNASGQAEIYVQPFPDPTGGKWMVSKGGGGQPRWRRDGKELFYTSISGPAKLMAVEVSTSPVFRAGIPKTLFQFPSGPPAWDVTGDGQKFIKATAPEAATTSPSPITVVLNWTAGLKK
jgi:Tol biopolymer transport system component/predicted Ser/Thr protein kinase